MIYIYVTWNKFILAKNLFFDCFSMADKQPETYLATGVFSIQQLLLSWDDIDPSLIFLSMCQFLWLMPYSRCGNHFSLLCAQAPWR